MLNATTKRVLITGASGFIGGYLAEEAYKRGYEVWVAVRKNSNRSRLTQPGLHFIEIDYRSEEAVARLANEAAPTTGEPAWHYVIHNAGITKAKDAKEFVRINAEQTGRFARGLAAAAVPPELFLLMSSMGSYGPPAGAHEPLKSSQQQKPANAYGKSKLLSEHEVAGSGLPYIILQPTGVYGPGDRDYLLSLQAIAKGFDFITGPKPQLLTFVHAGDVARAALFLLEQPEAQGKSYIISDGNSYTDIEYGKLAQELLQKKHVLHLRCPLGIVRIVCQIGEWWGHLTGRLSPLNKDKYTILSQRNWLCDATPLFELGFTPKYDLRSGLKETINYAKEKGLL
ncbi:NAD-dependent epimerase/dehydratase family protein [Porphyromonas macacae]|uniref:NAD-dependent epimerase/dehydratase family protein n=1 Tax=Porphyromonas macacae TaxID=28115 RepID=UPI0024AE1F25|nr:NAD(P)-dependent oxidoreductase [Porphyromonas macacae]